MLQRSRGNEKNKQSGPKANMDISASKVRVIDEDGSQLGDLSLEAAVAAAEERDLDLVEVSPNSDPPVCKIMDLGRYKYIQQKRHKKQKRNKKL